MGFGGISIWQLLIILAIVVLLFGTKRLRSFGGDFGSAVKGFRKAMDTSDKEEEGKNQITEEEGDVIEGQAEKASETEDNQKQS